MYEIDRWSNLKSSFYMLVSILAFLTVLLIAGGCATPKKNVSPPRGKSEITSNSQAKGHSSLFLYRLVLLGGVGYIIYLLLKPKNSKINNFNLSELKSENQKVKIQNEFLSKQIGLQDAEKTRILGALREKETNIKSMLENEGFLSKSFSEFKKHADKLQNDKDHLEKQLGEKEKELESCRQQLKKNSGRVESLGSVARKKSRLAAE